MMHIAVAIWCLTLFGATSFAAPASGIHDTRATAPTVKLDSATFTGASDGATSKFLGIPFAKPPVGDLRFRRPVPVDAYTGSHTSTSFGPACPQQAPGFSLPPSVITDIVDEVFNLVFGAIFPDDEDCLTINVVKPASATSTSKLPVVVWFFGGGFHLGSPSMYDGGVIVKRSLDLNLPVIYVSINSRIGAWGFLGGSEVKAAGVGNLGLRDQREGLKWVQKYIGAFGGDPTKVTIWGESAGAISSALHMVAYGGVTGGLFRGAFMQSGSTIPVGDISKGQASYDHLVAEVGCSSASDTLQCLRGVPYASLKSKAIKTAGVFDYSSLSLTWLPRVDGDFLTENPMQAAQNGRVASVPYITGDLDDEGSLFTLGTLNITTSAEFREWVHSNFLPAATESEVDRLMSLYPSSLPEGSPYDTGYLNALTPQSKRIASFQGDLVFQAPRRFFLENTASKQKAWSYLSKRLKSVPFLGSFHGSDILNVYGGGELTDYLVRFVVNLDPNVGPADITLASWPQWTNSSRKALLLQDGLPLFNIGTTTDTYRTEEMKYLSEISLKYPL